VPSRSPDKNGCAIPACTPSTAGPRLACVRHVLCVGVTGSLAMFVHRRGAAGALAGALMLLVAPIAGAVGVASVPSGAHGAAVASREAGVASFGASGATMRLRGGFVRTLAPSVQARSVPNKESYPMGAEGDDFESFLEQAHTYATKADPSSPRAGNETTPRSSQATDVQTVDAATLFEGGKDIIALGQEDADEAEAPVAKVRTAEEILWRRAHPINRASVNAEAFDTQSCGRNMVLGSTGRIPLPFRSIPFPLPLLLALPLPMFVPLPFPRAHTRVRLQADSGTWLNHAIKSPIAPAPSAFSPRRSDPIEAMQRRPFMVIPLDVQGPANQPHPLCQPIRASECSGGMAYSSGHMRPNGQGALSYMEVRAGGPSRLSCVGVVDAEATFDDEATAMRQADFAGSPRSDCLVAAGNGAFRWALDGTEQVRSELPDKRRRFRAGDRVGVLVDLDEGRFAILKNGRVRTPPCPAPAPRR